MQQATTAMIDERIKHYFQTCLNQSLENTHLLPGDPTVDLAEEVAYLRDSIKQMKRQLASRSFSPSVIQDAKEMLNQSPMLPEIPDLETLHYASIAILRAKIEDARILASKLSGDYAETAPLDPLFQGMTSAWLPPIPGENTAADTKINTLRIVGERYCAFKGQHDWVAKTAADTRRVLDIAYEAIEAEKPIGLINTDDVKAVRDLISDLPPNYTKFKKNEKLSLKQIVDNHGNGLKLSVKTQDKYFGFFKSFLHWASDEGYIDKQPGSNIKIAGSTKSKESKGRDPYSDAQLQVIFDSPLFTGHRSETIRYQAGSSLSRDGKFWIPLIGLYAGMRLGEIVQLLASDLKQEKGIWYFDITKSEDKKKKLKTASSIRRVPVHHTLTSLGLIELIYSINGDKRLFSELEQGADGYYSHNVSKWWGRYGKQVGFWTPRTVFHSFRHNFKDALDSARVLEIASKQLMGHSDKSVHAMYGSGPSIKMLKEEIDKIEYPLDLTKLRAATTLRGK